MGDSTITGTEVRPGIMIVRPSLHDDIEENRAIFKRWTVMHFRDLLNLPSQASSSSARTSGITRALRYVNTAGELFYTIHVDDIGIWETEGYKERSRRLDLENTRPVEEGEEKVLKDGCAFEQGSMVWDVCNAEFAILEELERTEMDTAGASYQKVPFDLLSKRGETPIAPPGALVTLTYTAPEEYGDLPERLAWVKESIVKRLALDYASVTNSVYTSIYRHLPTAQPDMHPTITGCKDGNGSWVLCVFVHAQVYNEQREKLRVELDDDVERMKRDRKGDGDWNVRVGVWKGEVFMS